MKDIIVVSTPAIIDVDFDGIKKELSIELAKYDIVVTADTVVDAKKLAAQLNRVKKIVDDKRKEVVASASAPIKAYESSMKDVAVMCTEGRTKILDQVRVYEDVTRELAGRLLAEELHRVFGEHDIKLEFRTASIADLIKLNSVTGGGKLAKAARDAVEKRVGECRQLQDRVSMRLLQLENESLNRGLLAPLERSHINHFLFDSDEEYIAQLSKVVSSEIARQEEAERKIKARDTKAAEEKLEVERAKIRKEEQERAAIEAKEKADATELARQEEAAKEVVSAKADPEPEQQAESRPQVLHQSSEELNYLPVESDASRAPAPIDGFDQPAQHSEITKCFFQVNTIFEFEADDRISIEKIHAEFEGLMKNAGIKSLKKITVAKSNIQGFL